MQDNLKSFFKNWENIMELATLENIKSRSANIGIIGLGYVGLPLVKEFLKKGFRVTGFDIDHKKVDLLKQGISYIKHIDFSDLEPYLLSFTPTTDFSRLPRLFA